MGHTKKQALFAKIYLLTGDTARAFNEAGYKSGTTKTQVLKSPGVQKALNELRKKQESYIQRNDKTPWSKSKISRDDVLFSLAELRDRAMKKGNYQTALKAITEISRLLGFYDKKPGKETKKDKPYEAPVNLKLLTTKSTSSSKTKN